ncbi:MAG: UDP-glucose 4-epimerase GalE [Desulfovibrionaceae bacterium]|nr:UDP-glucose 4-epimerase GalE [Desulfovibrionaceae bacterium]
MLKQVAVIGGAGYIGSHAAMTLHAAGYDVVVFDNLSTGHAEFLRFGRHVRGDLGDPAALDAFFAANDIRTVMHFAACAYVGESVSDPAKYYRNNVANTLNLLDCCRKYQVANVIFSSTCSTYGVPTALPITEDHPQQPINPYGRTKLAIEWALQDFSAAYGLRVCSLRYFNAAGAAPASLRAGIGEKHDPETHLIPLVLKAAGNPPHDLERGIRVFGTDYDTKDGTCIRDYIHVCDLADAHILAMQYLEAGGGRAAFNLGNGQGYSVREVIDSARRVTGLPIKAVTAARRPGDPGILIGDAARAVSELGWKPKFAGLDDIVQSAWDWERSLSGQQQVL